MTLTKEVKYSVSEVLDVLKHMDEDDIDKIPLNVIKNLNANKDEDYVSTIDFKKSLSESKISHNALSMLAYIYREYLCNDSEKMEYDKMLYNNQIKHEENFDTQSLFQNKKTVAENTDLPVNIVHESFFRKILNKIKKFFKI